jgi:acetyl esterase/lipase
MSAYFYLLKKGIPSLKIVCCGDSAGGGLSIAMCLAIRDGNFGVHPPAGIIALSPWVDLSSSTASFSFNGKTDFAPSGIIDPHLEQGRKTHYCPNDELRNPYDIEINLCRYVSPMFARSLNGLPPMLIQCGEVERLREEAAIFAFRAVVTPYVAEVKGARTKIVLEVYQDQVHVFQMFPNLIAGKKGMRTLLYVAIDRCAEFIRKVPIDPTDFESSNTFYDHRGELIKRMSFDGKLGLFSAKL